MLMMIIIITITLPPSPPPSSSPALVRTHFTTTTYHHHHHSLCLLSFVSLCISYPWPLGLNPTLGRRSASGGTLQQLRPMRTFAASHAPARGRFGPCSYCGFAIPKSHRRQCPCWAVYYCNELCQERDWALHRNACPYDGWKSAARRALKPLPRNVEANISDFLSMGREMKGPHCHEVSRFCEFQCWKACPT